MTPEDLEHLAAEGIPDGTFGGRRPRRDTSDKRPQPDPQATEHRARLLDALSKHQVSRRRHLRVVPTPPSPSRKAS